MFRNPAAHPLYEVCQTCGLQYHMLDIEEKDRHENEVQCPKCQKFYDQREHKVAEMHMNEIRCNQCGQYYDQREEKLREIHRHVMVVDDDQEEKLLLDDLEKEMRADSPGMENLKAPTPFWAFWKNQPQYDDSDSSSESSSDGSQSENQFQKTDQSSTKMSSSEDPYSLDNVPEKLTSEEFKRYTSGKERPVWWKKFMDKQKTIQAENRRKAYEKQQKERDELLGQKTDEKPQNQNEPTPEQKKVIMGLAASVAAAAGGFISSTNAGSLPYMPSVPQAPVVNQATQKRYRSTDMKDFWRKRYAKKRLQFASLLSMDTSSCVKKVEYEEEGKSYIEIPIRNVSTNEDFTFKVCIDDKVELTKMRLGQKISTSHLWITLILAGKKLENDKLLSEYNIKPGVRVWLLIRPPPNLQPTT